MKKLFCVILCLILCPLTVSAASSEAQEKTVQEGKKDKSSDKEKTIALHFRPKEKVKETPKDIPEAKIFFEELRDERPRPKEIGENLENKDKRILITTSDENGAAKFVHTVLKNAFRDKGFSLEESAGAAQKIIKGTLVKFWTVEEKRYRSEIQLKIEVRDRSNHLYYQRTYVGEGSNFGRSLSEFNYQEAISESLARMLDSIFSDDSLLKALAERPKPTRTEEKAAPAATPETPSVKGQPTPTPSKTKKPAPGKPTGPVFGPK